MFNFFRKVWQCPLCETSYSSNEIEYQLINLAQNRSMAYVLQDLQCDRCVQVC